MKEGEKWRIRRKENWRRALLNLIYA